MRIFAAHQFWSRVGAAGLFALALAGLAALSGARGSAAAAPAPAPGKAPLLILDTRGSMWRYFETWQTDVARTEAGELVPVDALHPRVKVTQGEGDKKTTAFQLQPAKQTTGSPFPPDDWRKPEFDDSRWLRRHFAIRPEYRSVALMCLRGKFAVADPAQAPDLMLSVGFRGGAVAYLNGQEIGRAYLPKGPITPQTLADDYPRDCTLTAQGGLISQFVQYSGFVAGGDDVAEYLKGADVVARVKQRNRSMELAVPRGLLRQGVNVLAIEVHRAPAHPAMFTTLREEKDRGTDVTDLDSRVRSYHWWDRVSIDAVKLTAPAGATGITPNSAAPKGLHVYTQDAMETVNFTHHGDPNEPIVPIRLCGARNGAYAGEVVLTGSEPIRNVKVTVSEIKLESSEEKVESRGAIKAEVRYCLKAWEESWVPDPLGCWIQFDTLDPAPPAETPLIGAKGAKTMAVLPIWVTVGVPRDARAGDYAGRVTIQAEGLPQPIIVPLQLHVSDFTLPDARDFVTLAMLVQSPDSVALQYNVPMWSDEHWKLLDKDFALLGEVGCKQINLPIIRRTHFGNEHGMVRWVKQADGTYKHDFTILERYLDAAIKHLGKVPVVCVNVMDTGPFHAQGLAFTEVDATTGELKEGMGPKWGTPEAVAFVKPVLAGIRERLVQRGMEKSMMLGMYAAGGNGPEGSKEAFKDVSAAAGPEARYYRVSHYWSGAIERRPDRPKWGCVAPVGGVIGVFWDPDEDKPIYGWRNPLAMLVYPRTTNGDYAGTRLGQESSPPEYRLSAEAVLLSGRRKSIPGYGRGNIAGEDGYDQFMGLRGYGPFGADFWAVLKGGKSNKPICGRYGDSYAEGGWGTLSFNQVTQSLLAPGKDGPISTARLEMMRESVQEADVRVFVQNALLDDAAKARLGPDLARRCQELCDERTRALRYVSEFWTLAAVQDLQPRSDIVFAPQWQERSRRLHDLAAEVAKALGKN